MLLSRRSLSAIVATVDVALHARPEPVTSKALAARHGLGPRHLEPILQALVRVGILKGVRGPRGGYQLARERRRVSLGDVVRATARLPDPDAAGPASSLVAALIEPAIAEASGAFLAGLDAITVDDLCARAGAPRGPDTVDFTI